MRIEGLVFAGIGSPDHAGLADVFVDVLGVEAATAELAARGVEPDGALLSWYGLRYRRFRAPDGRRFELLGRRL